MIRAAWLGHWKPPWGVDRGRRWGDPIWALAAISQAWLLGGRESRWPRLNQEAQRPLGPQVLQAPETWDPRPDPAWVARLRHGSPAVPADRRGPRENELLHWAWEALLEGDGTPWMAAGTVLLDRPARLTWVAHLGAVDAVGTLLLPPWLDLVPAPWRSLPSGWWETLLRAQDSEGRLLPEGALEPTLPWARLQPWCGPLTLDSLPRDLAVDQGSPWLQALPDGTWMLDPALRAWGRGWGASPGGLAPYLREDLASGGSPAPAQAAVLALRLPGDAPPGWGPALAADLGEDHQRPPLPPASGHPSWDRLRMRWGGEAAAAAPGYPAWGTGAHPCADPFHWMAEGRRALQGYDPEAALRAFTLAHAHFTRLRAPAWGERAAYNAAVAALQWADLPAHGRWAALRGPLAQPWRDMEAAQLAEVHLEPEAALVQIRALVAEHPTLPGAWGLLASHGADQAQWDLVQEGLDRAEEHPYIRFLSAALGPLTEPPPEEADPETRLSWEAHRLFRGAGSPEAFWSTWRTCPTQIMRLELGVQVLERVPGERRPRELLALQAIADRAHSPRHQRRLAALWPRVDQSPEPSPRQVLEEALATRSTPAWIAWEEDGLLQTLGAGEPPPAGALGRLAREGSLPPCVHGPWIWQGQPLRWEGLTVGGLLLGQDPDAAPVPALEARLLAPWVARLRERPPDPADLAPGLLLTDGSEPMATLLRELDRVAPTTLPVLILGPTGSGKELAALQLHQRSERRGALVAVNCSAFAEGLLESELFGHVKGAFTGADRERRGAIEAARDGTLFLDEIADLSPRLQSLLLRVIQEQEVRRVGSDHAVKVDVRFVAATHLPVEDLAAVGTFRRDLLFRLQGAVLRLPALAARRHEFPFLLPKLSARAAQLLQRPAPALAPGLAEALGRLPWPGNVRELLHALERAILRCGEGTLRPAHFPELAAPATQAHTWEDATRAFQRRLLLDTLRTCGHRVAEAAETLGLARPAFYATAKRLGVDLIAERLQRPE